MSDFTTLHSKTYNEFKEIEGEDYNQPVYNFTVEDIHSYIADGVIVHNK